MIIHELLKLIGYDAETQIAAKVTEALEETRLILVEGEGGLTRELKNINYCRSQLRSAGLEKLFSQGGNK